MKCILDGCSRPSRTTTKRGMCAAHIRRLRYGSPMFGRKQIAKRPLHERFWEKVSKGPGCWEWLAYRNRKGYGRIQIAGRNEEVHRVSWEFENGPIPAGMCVCHHCDNRRCVRPDHLFLGMNTTNTADMVAKGRAAKGERVARAKLTADQVMEIRRRRAAGERTQDIADEFGFTYMGLYQAAVGLTWKHLPTIGERNLVHKRR